MSPAVKADEQPSLGHPLEHPRIHCQQAERRHAVQVLRVADVVRRTERDEQRQQVFVGGMVLLGMRCEFAVVEQGLHVSFRYPLRDPG